MPNEKFNHENPDNIVNLDEHREKRAARTRREAIDTQRKELEGRAEELKQQVMILYEMSSAHRPLSDYSDDEMYKTRLREAGNLLHAEISKCNSAVGRLAGGPLPEKEYKALMGQREPKEWQTS